MATIERRISYGQTVYYAKVRRKGFALQSATFHKLGDAKRWAQTTEAAITEGRYFPQTSAKTHTLSEIITKYLDEVLPDKNPITIKDQTWQLKWWDIQLGQNTLENITPALLSSCSDKLSKARKNATVNQYLAALSHVFTITHT